MACFDLAGPSALLLLLRQGWWSTVIVRSVLLSFVTSVNSVTHECGNRRRPNMVDIGKG